MASIRKEILIEARPENVWAAVRDVGAVHQRLVPGVLVDARLDGDARVVTFASGAVARELLVDVDDKARRFAYEVVEGPLRATHHNASMQFLPTVRAAAGSSGSPTCYPTTSLRLSAHSLSRDLPT
jgi:hypothetical protein